jgi:hypothetical protein
MCDSRIEEVFPYERIVDCSHGDLHFDAPAVKIDGLTAYLRGACQYIRPRVRPPAGVKHG